MPGPTIILPLAPSSLSALEAAAGARWSGIDFDRPVEEIGEATVRSAELCIRAAGEGDFIITGWPEVVIPPMEAFGLGVRAVGHHLPASQALRRDYVDAGEFFAAFLGTAHQILVVRRRYEVPEWARRSAGEIHVDDMLLLRHPSGQQALIMADPSVPGTLVATRILGGFPPSNVVSIRCVG